MGETAEPTLRRLPARPPREPGSRAPRRAPRSGDLCTAWLRGEIRFEYPAALRVADQVGLVDHVQRVFLEHPVRLEPEVRREFLGGHEDRRGRLRKRQAEWPGVLGLADDRRQPPVEVAPQLAAKAMRGDDDACRASATRDMCRDDVLRHQRRARARGEGQHEPPYVGIGRVRRAVEQVELRRPERQHRRVTQGHRSRRGRRHCQRQTRPDRRGAEIVGDVLQVRRDPSGLEVGLGVGPVGALVENWVFVA